MTTWSVFFLWGRLQRGRRGPGLNDSVTQRECRADLKENANCSYGPSGTGAIAPASAWHRWRLYTSDFSRHSSRPDFRKTKAILFGRGPQTLVGTRVAD